MSRSCVSLVCVIRVCGTCVVSGWCLCVRLCRVAFSLFFCRWCCFLSCPFVGGGALGRGFFCVLLVGGVAISSLFVGGATLSTLLLLGAVCFLSLVCDDVLFLLLLLLYGAASPRWLGWCCLPLIFPFRVVLSFYFGVKFNSMMQLNFRGLELHHSCN